MKILLVSAFTQNHPELQPGNYLQKTGDGLKKGFEALSHSVDCFDYRHIEEISKGPEIWEYRLKKYLENDEERELIASQGAERASHEFTWKAIADKICNCAEGK